MTERFKEFQKLGRKLQLMFSATKHNLEVSIMSVFWQDGTEAFRTTIRLCNTLIASALSARRNTSGI
jgi:hypothetical protein